MVKNKSNLKNGYYKFVFLILKVIPFNLKFRRKRIHETTQTKAPGETQRLHERIVQIDAGKFYLKKIIM